MKTINNIATHLLYRLIFICLIIVVFWICGGNELTAFEKTLVIVLASIQSDIHLTSRTERDGGV